MRGVDVPLEEQEGKDDDDDASAGPRTSGVAEPERAGVPVVGRLFEIIPVLVR